MVKSCTLYSIPKVAVWSEKSQHSILSTMSLFEGQNLHYHPAPQLQQQRYEKIRRNTKENTLFFLYRHSHPLISPGTMPYSSLKHLEK